MGEFEAFWKAYPLKVGKLAAQREYDKVRKVHQVSQVELLDGIARYKENKPAYADWAHARTWLHQGRWMDEYKSARIAHTEDWFTECKRIHGGACGLSQHAHHTRKQIEAGKAEAKR